MKKLFSAIMLSLLFQVMISAQSNTILFVMSAADTIALNDGNILRQTGIFLNEFYFAYQALEASGYQVEFATPKSQSISIDQESLKDEYWSLKKDFKNEAINFIQKDPFFNNPISISKAYSNRSKYRGMIIPGGQGIMVDLFEDPLVPELLKYFANELKPTGLICHTPSLLLTIPKNENPYLGYTVNSVSLIEEFYIERFIMKGELKRRKISKQLKKLGLKYKSKFPKSDYAVRDRNLITSQNPFSGASFNILYLEALSDYAH